MSPSRSRGFRWAQAVLFTVFVVMPMIEIYVIVQVGQEIGVLWTVALLVLSGVVGTWLIRHEGARTWQSLREALDSGRMPATEIADGALILVGGTLMVAPGFITDILGILLIFPLTRPIFRSLLAAAVSRRLLSGAIQVRRSPGPGPSAGPVVRGEVVDDDDDR
jgi:UPF0716 protein FxsA